MLEAESGFETITVAAWLCFVECEVALKEREDERRKERRKEGRRRGKKEGW